MNILILIFKHIKCSIHSHFCVYCYLEKVWWFSVWKSWLYWYIFSNCNSGVWCYYRWYSFEFWFFDLLLYLYTIYFHVKHASHSFQIFINKSSSFEIFHVLEFVNVNIFLILLLDLYVKNFLFFTSTKIFF